MRRWIPYLLSLSVVFAVAAPAAALNSGTDILVPAAAKSGSWVTDLYIMNPGDDTVDGTVYWLVRDQGNPDPVGIGFTLMAGETAVMDDIIGNDFGLDGVGGAFRVVADGEVVVNSRLYSQGVGQTFGQGFEGVPATLATAAGETTQVVGLSKNSSFRTNFYATTGAQGAVLWLTLVHPDGSHGAESGLTLNGAYRPYLRNITSIFGSNLVNFDDATLLVEVQSGSAVVGASKVDEVSTDPTTLESAVPMGAAATVDGTYHFAVYDEETYAAGGNLVISGGVVQAINGTYMNWEKDEDSDGFADCPYIFLWGVGFSPTAVADFTDGVDFSDDWTATGGGNMAWTVEFTMDGNTAFSGTVNAVGTNFPSSTDPYEDQSGCNGTYPELVLVAGKTN